MCGRFTLTADPAALIKAFQLEFFPDDYEPGYNIAPSEPVLAAVQTSEGRKAGYITWGLVPFWVKERKRWKPLINARSESLTEKPSFKRLITKRRCVIFADSFYEWKVDGGKKYPYRIMMKDGRPFAFAGLWDRNKNGEGEITTCTILTTEANGMVSFLHERMPVILHNPEQVDRWLNYDIYSYEDAKEVISPLPEEKTYLYRVSPIVNSPKNRSKECIRPVTDDR